MTLAPHMHLSGALLRTVLGMLRRVLLGGYTPCSWRRVILVHLASSHHMRGSRPVLGDTSSRVRLRHTRLRHVSRARMIADHTRLRHCSSALQLKPGPT